MRGQNHSPKILRHESMTKRTGSLNRAKRTELVVIFDK